MRKFLAEALIIALETALVLAIVAVLGVPAAKGPKADDERGAEGPCVMTGNCPSTHALFDFRGGRWPAD